MVNIKENLKLIVKFVVNPNLREGFFTARKKQADRMVLEYPPQGDFSGRTFILHNCPGDPEKEEALAEEWRAFSKSLLPGSISRCTILDKRGNILYFSGDCAKERE